MDAFSSKDLTNWKKHERIIDTASVKWAEKAMWAPSVIEKNGKYYIVYHRRPLGQKDRNAREVWIDKMDSK